MKNIKKSFGATQALKKIDFDLKEGEVHGLLGENGAGKSTLIKILGGIHQPDEGTIEINDNKIKIENVQKAQENGIGIIHQEIVLVPYLTIAQNIFLGREITNKMGMENKQLMRQEAEKMLSSFGLDYDVDEKVGNLTIAQQQMIEIIKAISFNVKILIMDEPTSSLSDEEVEKLFKIIKILQRKNVGIIYISHRMEELFKITDRITVIRDGEYIETKITKETDTDSLVALMVGRKLEKYYIREYCEEGEEVLKVENLTKKGVFENINFEVKKGMILGFAGLVGAGRSEVMMSIFGGIPYDTGNIYIFGEKKSIKNCEQAIDNRIAYVPEDRKKQGLTLIKSIGYNITLASLKHITQGIFVNEYKRKNIIDKYIKELSIKTSSAETAAENLSGGNQQKVVIAKWLSTNPELLILDEPTRGIDVGAKAEIYTIINKLAKEGIAIIIVSSELPELINMCNEVCIMRNGKIVKKLSQKNLTQENIMKYATGGIN
jgi:ABC-type sugar transport system, ATPase component